jgi:hypothetical protein
LVVAVVATVVVVVVIVVVVTTVVEVVVLLGTVVVVVVVVVEGGNSAVSPLEVSSLVGSAPAIAITPIMGAATRHSVILSTMSKVSFFFIIIIHPPNIAIRYLLCNY